MGLFKLIRFGLTSRPKTYTDFSSAEEEAIDTFEPFIPPNHKVKSMKINERQLVMLLDVAKWATEYARDNDIEIGSYSQPDVNTLLSDIADNMSTELVDVSSPINAPAPDVQLTGSAA